MDIAVAIIRTDNFLITCHGDDYATNYIFNPLPHSVKGFLASETKKGNATYCDNSFDLMTFRDHSTTHFVDDSGNNKELQCNERFYVPSEITWLLKTLNFKTVEIFGAKLGPFQGMIN